MLTKGITSPVLLFSLTLVAGIVQEKGLTVFLYEILSRSKLNREGFSLSICSRINFRSSGFLPIEKDLPLIKVILSPLINPAFAIAHPGITLRISIALSPSIKSN